MFTKCTPPFICREGGTVREITLQQEVTLRE